MNSTQVTIEALITSQPEKVWRYWTEPSHITQWNFATDDWCCPSAESENPIEMQRDGWQAIMDNFKKYAKSR